MAATDRNKNGKATDVVCHYATNDGYGTLCRTRKYKLTTDGSKAQGPVTCKKCARLIYQINKTQDLLYRGKDKIKVEIDLPIDNYKPL